MTSKSEPQPKDAAKHRKAALSQGDVPGVRLSEALRIPFALRDSYAMKPATPVDVGLAIGIAPTSGGFRTLTGAAIAYGLTTGGYNAAEIALTPLGMRVVAPTEEGDDKAAKIEAFEKPRVIHAFVAKYQGNKLPSKPIAQNILHSLGVPLEATERAYELIMSGLKDLGYVREINGSLFVQRPQDGPSSGRQEAATIPQEGIDSLDAGGKVNAAPPAHVPTTQGPQVRPNAIFLGHGKNKKPMEQLIQILDEYRIPHKEAVAEPNAGRPIPTKVAETMRACGAAILIFTADEHFRDEDGNDIWRPSENVVHELGAASVLYDNRIIIFKEEGLTLASNFSGIGYISFAKDKLNDKGIELFRELVNFKIVNITVG